MDKNDNLNGNYVIMNSLYSGDKYGYEIRMEINKNADGLMELKEPTLYSCLKRLEKSGFVYSYFGDGTDTNGGRRRYYSLTEKGRFVVQSDLSANEYYRSTMANLTADIENTNQPKSKESQEFMRATPLVEITKPIEIQNNSEKKDTFDAVESKILKFADEKLDLLKNRVVEFEEREKEFERIRSEQRMKDIERIQNFEEREKALLAEMEKMREISQKLSKNSVKIDENKPESSQNANITNQNVTKPANEEKATNNEEKAPIVPISILEQNRLERLENRLNKADEIRNTTANVEKIAENPEKTTQTVSKNFDNAKIAEINAENVEKNIENVPNNSQILQQNVQNAKISNKDEQMVQYSLFDSPARKQEYQASSQKIFKLVEEKFEKLNEKQNSQAQEVQKPIEIATAKEKEEVKIQAEKEAEKEREEYLNSINYKQKIEKLLAESNISIQNKQAFATQTQKVDNSKVLGYDFAKNQTPNNNLSEENISFAPTFASATTNYAPKSKFAEFKIKPYIKDNEKIQKKWIYQNKLLLATSCITYLIFFIFCVTLLAIFNSFVPKMAIVVIVSLLVAGLFPLFFYLNKVFAPNKKKKANFNFRSALLNSVLAFCYMFLCIMAINLIFQLQFADIAEIVIKVFIPTFYSFIIVIFCIVYAVLYNSQKYHC